MDCSYGESKSTLRIAHVVSLPSGSGVDRVIEDLANEQARIGHEVLILDIGETGIIDACREGARARLTGGRGASVRAVHIDNRKRLSPILRSAEILSGVAPDVIHAHSEHSVHYASWGKILTQAPLVMSDHGLPRRFLPAAGAADIAAIDAIVVPSSAAVFRWSGTCPDERLSSIATGIAPRVAAIDRRVVRQTYGCVDDDVVSIALGQIDGRNGHEDILRAITRLSADSSHLRVWFAGDGQVKSAIEEIASSLRLPPNRLRFVDGAFDMSDLLAAADCCLFVPIADGPPAPLLAAMSAGLASIVTPIGAIVEAVRDGSEGLHVPVRDADAIADGLTLMSRDDNLRKRLGVAARSRALETFAVEKSAAQYERLYRAVMRNRGFGRFGLANLRRQAASRPNRTVS